MVSTRRKSYIAGAGTAGQEQLNAESSTNSPVRTPAAIETPSTRRSASKSARSRASQSESDAGAASGTPLRRSRRLSNSSVGSNDDDSDATAVVSSTKKRKTKVEETGSSSTEQADERVQLPPINETEETEEPAVLDVTQGETKNANEVEVTSQEGKVRKPAAPESITPPEEASVKKLDEGSLNKNKEANPPPEKSKDAGIKTHPVSQKDPSNSIEEHKQNIQIPRGKPKSGRVWKEPRTNPRTMYKDRGVKMPLEKVLQLKEERQRVKEIQSRLKEEQRRAKEDLRRRQELNRKKREENEKKGEIVQVIRNSAKLKRMKKKQLKLIQKRDTTNM